MRHTFLKLSESEPCVAFKYVHILLSLSSVKWFITTKDNCTNQNRIVHIVKTKDVPEINPAGLFLIGRRHASEPPYPTYPFIITIRGLALIQCLFWSDEGFIPAYLREKPVSQVWQIKRKKKHLCVYWLQSHTVPSMFLR